jgi:hypothetical protein
MADAETLEMSEATETVEAEVKAEKAEAKTYPESYVKKIHTENAQRRQREKELEEKLAAFEKAELDKEKDLEKRAKSERDRADKLEKEVAQERAALQRERIVSKAEALAVRAGFRDDAIEDLLLRPELAEAKVEDLPELIDGFKKSKPHWLKAEQVEKTEAKTEKRVVTTPQRKEGQSSLDYSTLKDGEFSKTMKERFGVDV